MLYLKQMIEVAGKNHTNNIQATSAVVKGPKGIAVDSTGALYIIDGYGPNYVYKVQSDILTIYAGGGENVVTNEVSSALDGRLLAPWHIAVDQNKNCYIHARSNDDFLYKLTESGNISIVAGGGDIYPTASNTPLAATSAKFISVSEIAADQQGNVYIVDSKRVPYIYKLDTNNNITVVTGGGSTTVSSTLTTPLSATDAKIRVPRSVAVDQNGVIYIVSDAQVYKVGQDNNISIIAGGGITPVPTDGTSIAATDAQISTIKRVVVDHNGCIYLYDKSTIMKIDASGNICVIAGGGSVSAATDGMSALSAKLDHDAIASIAVDAAGQNLYLSELLKSRVRVVDMSSTNFSDYTIKTAAGTGSRHFGGDGGPASAAKLGHISDLSFDALNSKLYFAIDDATDPRIRQIDLADPSPENQTISTYGKLVGLRHFVMDDAGVFYVVHHKGTGYQISKVTAVENGNLQVDPTAIAGGGSYDLDPSDPQPAPSTDYRFDAPTSIAMDNAAKALYVTDILWGSEGRLYKVDMSDPTGNYTLSLIAGGGNQDITTQSTGIKATDAILESPQSVVIDSEKNLYIADNVKNCVFLIDTNGDISIYAGGGSSYTDGAAANSVSLSEPVKLALDDSDNLFVSLKAANYVCVVEKGSQRIFTTAERYFPNISDSRNRNLIEPGNIAFGNNGLFISYKDWGSSSKYDRISKMQNIRPLTTVFASGASPSQLPNVSDLNGIAIDKTNKLLYFAGKDSNSQKWTIYKLDLNVHPIAPPRVIAGGGSTDVRDTPVSAMDANFGWVNKITINQDGSTLYICGRNGYVYEMDVTAAVPTVSLVAGGGDQTVTNSPIQANQAKLAQLMDIALVEGTEHSLYITGVTANCVYKVDLSSGGGAQPMISIVAGGGTTAITAAGVIAAQAQLNNPSPLAVMNQTVYIGDKGRILKLVDGTISLIAGNGTADDDGDGEPAIDALVDPYEMAIDTAGNLYFSQQCNHDVRKISAADSIVYTYVRNNMHKKTDYGSDGGAIVSRSESLYQPNGLALDHEDLLYIVERGGKNEIRKVGPVVG